MNLGPPLSTTPEEDRHQGAHHRPVRRLEEPHGGGQSGERGEEAATYQTLLRLLALFEERGERPVESGQTQKGRGLYFIWPTI